MDEVSRLTVLSQKLKVQLENQKLRLEEQGKEIVTSRQQIAFYRGENIDMRHKIKELERDLRMANSTIEDYEHLYNHTFLLYPCYLLIIPLLLACPHHKNLDI